MRSLRNIVSRRLRVLVPKLLNIAGKAFAQNFIATFHIAAQGPLFGQDFIVGKAGRHQGNANNQGNNQANAQ